MSQKRRDLNVVKFENSEYFRGFKYVLREAIKIENPVKSGNCPDLVTPPPPYHFS
jgi:hypothetical protein